jgi:alpha-glucosidase
VTTWLPVHPNYAEDVNVAAQEHDPDSLLAFYRRLLAVRRATPALVAGEYGALTPDAEDFLAFTRSTAAQTVLVILNFSARPQTVALTLAQARAKVLFSSTVRPSEVDDLAQIEVAPFEVYIAELL